MITPAVKSAKFPQPLDRVVLTVMLVLSLLIGVLLGSGDNTMPKVREFSWQNQQVGAEDTAFILTFNRPMDWESVAANLRIQPPLAGKVSWSGRRLAYTLTEPVTYGQSFRVSLEGAQEAGRGQQQQSEIMEPFTGTFHGRDQAIAYLGVTGEEAGRLVLYNLTRQQKTILTPADLVVAEFKPYTGGDRILFAATERARHTQGGFDPQLYTVTTGLGQNSSTTAGSVKQILDNREQQILKFDLSPDGKVIVVQLAARQQLGQTSLWLLGADGSRTQLENQSGGDFLITPDSGAIVIAQGQGLAVVPLNADQAAQPVDFLPQFGMVLSFTQDGTAAAMVKFNADFTRSLFLVTNQGVQKQLLKTTGSILSVQFDPQKQSLYCLLTRLLPSQTYNEQPYLAQIDLATGQLTPLLDLSGQRDLLLSLAPDGSALLFDQAVTSTQFSDNRLQTDQGEAIAASNLWLLPLTPADPRQKPQPEAIASGFHARWLP